MAIAGGVAPHNGWIEVAGQRFQVIRGTAEFNTLNSTNTLSATVPLNGPGYFEALAAVQGSDQEVKAIVLSGGNETELMTAKVKCITFHLTSTTIFVQGQDDLSQLGDQRTTDSWTNKKGHEIAGDLCSRIGLPFSGIASKVMAGKKVGQDFVKLTDNISYLTCIHKLAEMDGVRVYMDENGTVQYRPPGTGSGYSVYWKKPTPQNYMISDCLDLRVVHNLEASASMDSTVASYKPSTKQTNTGKATVPGTGTTKKLYQDTPNLEIDQANQLAKARADQLAEHEWEILATVVGDPSIKVDMNVKLSGSGLLDQTFPIDAVIHKFGMDGYTTQINAKGKGNRGS